ncbi:MAG: sel1 repeat family protein [Phaeodactylibacter sp.]|nr:sel1 repeat family protein [Phaeodactylibacter sp.]
MKILSYLLAFSLTASWPELVAQLDFNNSSIKLQSKEVIKNITLPDKINEVYVSGDLSNLIILDSKNILYLYAFDFQDTTEVKLLTELPVIKFLGSFVFEEKITLEYCQSMIYAPNEKNTDYDFTILSLAKDKNKVYFFDNKNFTISEMLSCHEISSAILCGEKAIFFQNFKKSRKPLNHVLKVTGDLTGETLFNDTVLTLSLLHPKTLEVKKWLYTFIKNPSTSDNKEEKIYYIGTIPPPEQKKEVQYLYGAPPKQEKEVIYHISTTPQEQMSKQQLEEEAKEPENPEYLYVLGYRYYYGKGVQKDLDKALFWLNEAAERGVPEAQYELGLIYLEKEETVRDINKGVSLLERAGKQGNLDAQTTLADFYLDKENYERAALWIQKVAEQGCPTCQYVLGMLYLNGLGIGKNLDEEAKIFWEQEKLWKYE